MMAFSPTSQRRLVFAGMAIALVAGSAWVWSLCARNPNVSFLGAHGEAIWIIYPKPPDGTAHAELEVSSVFRRSFQLERAPDKAKLTLRAFKRFEVKINGVETPLIASVRNWKDASEFDVAGMLHVGTNDISVTVFNNKGPPALWLSMEAGSSRINSDSAWEVSFVGAAWRPAWPASAAMKLEKGNPLFGGENTLDSLRKSLPMLLLLFTLLSGAITYGIYKFPRWSPKAGSANIGSHLGVRVLIVLAILWSALFLHNLGSLPREDGYDANAHEDYINYIRAHKTLPLANQGWEMCQPPLYYTISAAITSAFGATPGSEWATSLLRLFGLLTGIAHFTLIFLSLRLLFPNSPSGPWFGLILAAFVPEHLYISQYVTNEFLAAALVTGALYLCLRLLKEEQESWKLALGIGLCLGAALLTKFTAILAAPFIVGLLIWRLLTGPPAKTNARLRSLSTVLLTTFVVAGWHYIRVWVRFGTPLVHDWDPVSGFAWWTDMGFQTASYFTNFGQSLVRPYYSVFHGFGDAIYSSLWSDALYGGMASWEHRPPWNYQLMTAGLLLALLPTLIIITGFLACLARFLRRPEAASFIMLGVAFATGSSLLFLGLKLPFFCSVKAFYALITLLPMCAFGAVGWEILTKSSGKLRPVLYVATGVWALNAYASFWIPGGAPATHTLWGNYLSRQGRSEVAVKEFSEALRLDPHNVLARRFLATERVKAGDLDGAWQETKKLLADDPDDADGLLQAALLLAANGQLPDALRHARHAIAVAPDYALAYEKLGGWLAQTGKNQEAADAARQGLRCAPFRPQMHLLLATSLASLGEPTEANQHFQFACQLNPDWPEAHDQFGRFLAGLHQWDAGIDELKWACRLAPNATLFQSHLAQALEHQPVGPTIR